MRAPRFCLALASIRTEWLRVNKISDQDHRSQSISDQISSNEAKITSRGACPLLIAAGCPVGDCGGDCCGDAWGGPLVTTRYDALPVTPVLPPAVAAGGAPVGPARLALPATGVALPVVVGTLLPKMPLRPSSAPTGQRLGDADAALPPMLLLPATAAADAVGETALPPVVVLLLAVPPAARVSAA